MELINVDCLGFSIPNREKHYHLTWPVERVLVDKGGLYLMRNGQRVLERHYGETMLTGAREIKQYPRGTEIANYRQISAISTGELESIIEKMGLNIDTRRLAELMGVNITFSGRHNLSKLPADTTIQFYAGDNLEAELIVTAENLPCIIPGRAIEDLAGGKGRKFPKSAFGYRGFVAKVRTESLEQGRIAVGYDVVVKGVNLDDYLL